MSKTHSYSKLSMYETCPAQYKFRYLDKAPYTKSEKAQRGTDLHASIEDFLLRKKNTLPKDVMWMKDVILEARRNDAFVEHKLGFTKNFEAKCDFDSPDVWFRLVLDCAYLTEDTIIVPEWKSGKMYDDHPEQRKIYGMAAMKMWGWPSHEQAIVTTHYLDLQQTKPLRIDQRGATVVAGLISRRIAVLEKDKHFAPRPGVYCRWCGFSKRKGGPCRVG